MGRKSGGRSTRALDTRRDELERLLQATPDYRPTFISDFDAPEPNIAFSGSMEGERSRSSRYQKQQLTQAERSRRLIRSFKSAEMYTWRSILKNYARGQVRRQIPIKSINRFRLCKSRRLRRSIILSKFIHRSGGMGSAVRWFRAPVRSALSKIICKK